MTLSERDLALVRYALDRFRNEASWRGKLGGGNGFHLISADERRQIGNEARKRVSKERARITAANAAVPVHADSLPHHEQ